MAYDFPTSPVNGQVYDKFVYNSTKQSWVAGDSVEALAIRVSNAELLAPVGSIHMFAGSNAPTGYLLCEGQAISRSDYARLFTQISTIYGVGNGSTTFNIPDLRGRTPVGKSSSGTFANLNATGGSETHALDVTQIPAHTHIQNSHNHTQDPHTHTQAAHSHTTAVYSDETRLNNYMGAGANSGYGAAPTSSATPVINDTTATNQNTTATNQNNGSSSPHNNLQPYNTVNYIIKF